jgi:hypothetical protein
MPHVDGYVLYIDQRCVVTNEMYSNSTHRRDWLIGLEAK